jgi:hypothetical protein
MDKVLIREGLGYATSSGFAYQNQVLAIWHANPDTDRLR